MFVRQGEQDKATGKEAVHSADQRKAFSRCRRIRKQKRERRILYTEEQREQKGIWKENVAL